MRIVGSAFKAAKNAPVVRPIFLYQLVYDVTTNASKFWTSWSEPVIFNGQTYIPFAISHGGTSEDTSGKIQKASFRVANVSREIQAIIDANDGLRNRTLIITQVWYETLGDSTAFISDSYSIVDCMISETEAQFNLSSSLDVFDIRLPRREISRTFCRFRFKGEECGYEGQELRCNKSLTRCRELNNSENFGGFPSTPMQG